MDANEVRIEHLEKKVDLLMEVVETGNGKQSLKARVEKLEEDKREKRESTERRMKWILAVLDLGLIGNLIALWKLFTGA